MKVFYFLLVFNLFSCSSMRLYSDQQINIKKGCLDFEYREGLATTNIDIEGRSHQFMFDTGAGLTVLTDSTSDDKFSERKFTSFGSVKSADRKKIIKRLFSMNVQSKIFHSNNKVFAFINLPTTKCKKENFSGILGMDLFVNETFSLFLDFSNNKICQIPIEENELLIKTEKYETIKSTFSGNKIFVYVDIEGVEYKFKLDTGYTGSFLIPDNGKSKLKNPNMVLTGSYFSTASSQTVGREKIHEKHSIKFGNNHYFAKIYESTSIKAQNVGIEFMKGFNWIIDFKNKKIYIKRNQVNIVSVFKRRVSYLARASNVLKITTKEISQKKFNLGDTITSVNNQKVTAENICELQDFLNKTENWDSLVIETTKANFK